MKDKIITKTWDEFWGPLILIRFHENNPKRWSIREERAAWIFERLNLKPGARILDLGCGDGLLDICLARLGAAVTAVDRIASVVHAAQTEPDADLVNFLVDDIRHISLKPESFDLILALGLIGVMPNDDDARLIKSCRRWLADGGRLIIDCPLEPDKEPSLLKQEFDEGTFEMKAEYNPDTGYQRIIPRFYSKNGETIELLDSLDPADKKYRGVRRYIYPRQELEGLLKENKFSVEDESGRAVKEHFMLIATKT
jgi:SAM-dependent methyltransferase